MVFSLKALHTSQRIYEVLELTYLSKLRGCEINF